MRTRWIAVVAVLLLAGRAAGADDTAVDEVTRAEAEMIDALRHNDADRLGRLIADDYLSINPAGALRDKAQVMREFRTGDRVYQSIVQDDVRVRVYGESAVVTSRRVERATLRGKDAGGAFRSTRVYVKRDGHWQAVSLHTTRIPESAPPEPR
jgi:ketosteroid isomerase-like protein